MVVANCDGEGASLVSRAQQVVRMKNESKVAGLPHIHTSTRARTRLLMGWGVRVHMSTYWHLNGVSRYWYWDCLYFLQPPPLRLGRTEGAAEAPSLMELINNYCRRQTQCQILSPSPPLIFSAAARGDLFLSTSTGSSCIMRRTLLQSCSDFSPPG